MQNSSQWKHKVQEIFELCQVELKKTTSIGKKMLNASKTNTCLKEAYVELGILVVEAITNKELEWNNPQVKKLIETIKKCEKSLEEMEGEVNEVKFKEDSDQTEETDQTKSDEK